MVVNCGRASVSYNVHAAVPVHTGGCELRAGIGQLQSTPAITGVTTSCELRAGIGQLQSQTYGYANGWGCELRAGIGQLQYASRNTLSKH